MAGKRNEELRTEFIATFKQLAPYKHRYDVFRDFITMTAISLRNAVAKNDELEEEYLQIIHSYKEADRQVFPKLLALVMNMLDDKPTDIMGSLYMELELGNKRNGQFFTPSHVSELMAQIVHDGDLEDIKKPFITLSEPCCGAGGMVLAFVNLMLNHGHNPADKLWVQCVDIDRMVALMCYIQLSLWHVPAEVIVGDVLRLEVREVWHTPSHILGNWTIKLCLKDEAEATKEMLATEHESAPDMEISDVVSGSPNQTEKPIQFDFGF